MRPPASTSTRGHIVIEDVVKVYDAGGAAVMAVDHCSLEIEPGEICMIVGPSGCGKTTLLNAIAGFHEITSGRILMDGEVSSGMRRRVEIVRALMNDPKALLLDEPYRALDSLTKSVMHEALLEIYYRNKVTIFFITHDLEEAIFLGHRVAIMTTRPCKPKKVLNVDIPHPRDYSALTSKRFRELIEETNDAVHEEAWKAFQAGEKEGR